MFYGPESGIMANVPSELEKNMYSAVVNGIFYKCQLDKVD